MTLCQEKDKFSNVLPSTAFDVTVIDHPLVRVKLSRLRAHETSLADFREEMTELATLMTFEVTRSLQTRECTIQTPLAGYAGSRLARPIVLAPILRAGLGLLEGMLKILSGSSIAHIGLFRNEETRMPESYYFKAPADLQQADVIVADPMLATGGSACAAIKLLKEAGAQSIRFMCLVTCPPGIQRLQAAHPDVPIYTAAIDPELDDRAYIVPGLGDAGDRFFGTE